MSTGQLVTFPSRLLAVDLHLGGRVQDRMEDVQVPDTSELLTGEVNVPPDAEAGEGSDDDGLGDVDTTESVDDVYLNASEAARQEVTVISAAELKILHSSGDCKIRRG